MQYFTDNLLLHSTAMVQFHRVTIQSYDRLLSVTYTVLRKPKAIR